MENIWNELSEESKNSILSEYIDLKEKLNIFKDENSIRHSVIYRVDELEIIFGKENLNKKPQIKTWDDIVNYYPEIHNSLEKGLKGISEYEFTPIIFLLKCAATLKIAKLIELGYGGMITDEEWRDITKEKYTIYRVLDVFVISPLGACIDFPAFHTEEQAKEFLKHNEHLCKDYYMI